MASQAKWAGFDTPPRLAIEAVDNRILALSEYLTVYRAGAGLVGLRRSRRMRELRHDIARLHAWRYYLRGAARRPLWWRCLHGLCDWLGGRLGADQPGRRQQWRVGVQRLSAFSVVDRAYAALLEDRQGRLLTLGLAPTPFTADLQTLRESLLNDVACLQDERRELAKHAGRVRVVCGLLGRWVRARGWLGFPEGGARVMEP